MLFLRSGKFPNLCRPSRITGSHAQNDRFYTRCVKKGGENDIITLFGWAAERYHVYCSNIILLDPKRPSETGTGKSYPIMKFHNEIKRRVINTSRYSMPRKSLPNPRRGRNKNALVQASAKSWNKGNLPPLLIMTCRPHAPPTEPFIRMVPPGHT